MHPNTKATIATNMLASIPIPVGLGLLIQNPQKLRSTKIISARLFAYRLYAARTTAGARRTTKAARNKRRVLPPSAVRTAEVQFVNRQS
jgi:hypothetical protein